MIDDTKAAATDLPDDVKSWMDQVYRSLAEGIASQRVNAFSLILDDGSMVAAAFVANQPVGQQTLVPMGTGWVSHKGPPPVSPGKTRTAEFVEAHPVPERFVLPEDIEGWTKIKQH